jgi:hypothetical protein
MRVKIWRKMISQTFLRNQTPLSIISSQQANYQIVKINFPEDLFSSEPTQST